MWFFPQCCQQYLRSDAFPSFTLMEAQMIIMFYSRKSGRHIISRILRRREILPPSLSEINTPKHQFCGAHLQCWHPIWILFGVPAGPLLIQLSAGKVSEKQQKMPPAPWLLSSMRVPSSWLWPGPAPDIVATLGVNQWKEDLSLCLSK